MTGGGWSGGAKVLDNLSVPERPTNLDNSRARAYWVLFGHFFARLSFLSPLSWRRSDRLKYCLKGLKPVLGGVGSVAPLHFCT